MSMYFAFDSDEPVFLASEQVWGDAGDWIGTLDEKRYSQLKLLHKSGASKKIETLRKQLGRALREHLPDEAVASAVKTLIDAIDNNPRAESVRVTDGQEDNEEEEGFEVVEDE